MGRETTVSTCFNSVTVSVLFLLTLLSENPTQIAKARWVDTFIGCGVALIVAFAIPAWKSREIPAMLASVSRVMGRRYEVLARSLASSPEDRDPLPIRSAGMAVRDEISDLLTAFRTSEQEPANLSQTQMLRQIFEELRGCGKMAVMIEQALQNGCEGSHQATLQADAIARSMASLAEALEKSTPASVKPTAVTFYNSGEVERFLCRAEEFAERAMCGAGDLQDKYGVHSR